MKITVHPGEELTEKSRIMTLDNNSGHIDWAVVNKDEHKLVETGRINCYEALDASTNKTENLLHKLVNKIGNTGKFSSKSSGANRRVKRMVRVREDAG